MAQFFNLLSICFCIAAFPLVVLASERPSPTKLARDYIKGNPYQVQQDSLMTLAKDINEYLDTASLSVEDEVKSHGALSAISVFLDDVAFAKQYKRRALRAAKCSVTGRDSLVSALYREMAILFYFEALTMESGVKKEMFHNSIDSALIYNDWARQRLGVSSDCSDFIWIDINKAVYLKEKANGEQNIRVAKDLFLQAEKKIKEAISSIANCNEKNSKQEINAQGEYGEILIRSGIKQGKSRLIKNGVDTLLYYRNMLENKDTVSALFHEMSNRITIGYVHFGEMKKAREVLSKLSFSRKLSRPISKSMIALSVNSIISEQEEYKGQKAMLDVLEERKDGVVIKFLTLLVILMPLMMLYQRMLLKQKAQLVDLLKLTLSNGTNLLRLVNEINRDVTLTTSEARQRELVKEYVKTTYSYLKEKISVTEIQVGLFSDDLRSIHFPYGYKNDAVVEPRTLDVVAGKTLYAYIKQSYSDPLIGESLIFTLDVEKDWNRLLWDRPQTERTEEERQQSIIYLPLEIEGKLVGVFTVQSNEKNAYTKDHLLALTAVTQSLSLALRLVDARAENIFVSETIGHYTRNLISEYGKHIGMAIEQPQTDLLSYLILNQLNLRKIDTWLSMLYRDDRKIKLQQFDLYRVVQNVYKRFNTLALGKNITLEIDINRRIRVRSSKLFVEEIISNLVQNAMAAFEDHAEVGFNQIEVALLDDRDCYRIHVSDTGPGMEAKVKENLFTTAKPDYKSRGFGSYICRGLVDRLGGKISVLRTSPATGTTIEIKLPLK